jgi:hypothetical protein
MPETLTESYCERCGTRYEFAAPTKMTPMRRTRGLISGFKNYVLSQDSLSDSLTDAIRSQEEALASVQLDAFHSSFNFCIDCRQYTCTNCWNESAGRCQSCQPLPAAAPLADRFAATMGEVEAGYGMQFPVPEPSAWPALDLPEPEPVWVPEQVPMLAEVEPEPEPEWVPEPVLVEAEVEAVPEPEPVLVEAEAAPEPEPEPVWVPEPVLVEAEAVPEPAPEPVLVPEPEPEPVLVEAEAAPEPEPEPVPVEAEAEPEPEQLPEPDQLPYRPLRPISDTFLHYPQAGGADEGIAAAAIVDHETLAARRAQLDLLGLGDTPQGPVGPAQRNVLPYRSSGAAPRAAELQAAAAAAAGPAFWDASAREVAGAISQIGVRSCGHCELSLSASARFCRRCGTPQSQSA